MNKGFILIEYILSIMIFNILLLVLFIYLKVFIGYSMYLDNGRNELEKSIYLLNRIEKNIDKRNGDILINSYNIYYIIDDKKYHIKINDNKLYIGSKYIGEGSYKKYNYLNSYDYILFIQKNNLLKIRFKINDKEYLKYISIK